jgi:mRNA-degrading endonuclease RelE of RelBE toxin-antitoxin system
MPKDVLLSTPAQKQFNSLDGTVKERIKKALRKLVETGTGDTKRLKGVKGREILIRLRVGDYRLVYKEEPDAIFVIQIFHRGKGYDWLD